MIIIYTPYPSERIKYVLNYLFSRQLGLEWQLSDNRQKTDLASGFKINYANAPAQGYCHILPEGLLNETGFKQRKIEVTDSNGLKVIFKNNSENGYDIFSAVFYCLSRYEEYGDHEMDVHGRFDYKNSFLWKNNCLQEPLLDLWVTDFKKMLINRYGFKVTDFRQDIFSVLPTIDIDAAFAYKGRSIIRQMAGFAKSALELNFKEMMKRFSVTMLGAEDPNDNFSYQFRQLNTGQNKANYFIQVGEYGQFDKNIPASNKAFRAIIKSIADNGHTVGLHPSYQSHSDYNSIKKEKETLENITGMTVTDSRQHYLRFGLPKTYQTLLSLGFKREYSMGYSEVTGFRAATCRSFYWYDMENEMETTLEIIPFCVMDVAYKQFAKNSVSITLKESAAIRRTTEEVQGVFCFVFHNESLSNHRGWEGWKEVFEEWLKK